MSLLYLTEPGSILVKDGNRLQVKKDRDCVIKSIGFEKLEGVIIIGSAHLSTGLMTELLEREIPVTLLSSHGRFFGRLEPTAGYNVERQLLQFDAYNDKDFRLELSKKWIEAKIKNQRTLLRRYNRSRELAEVTGAIAEIEKLVGKVAEAQSLESVMGFEGLSSRIYFDAIAQILPAHFCFSGRNRQPPKDPFNSVISFGYTLVLYEIFAAITSKNLQPYLGFMHQPRRGHPALASDLLEEWRAILVDALAVSMLCGAELSQEDFQDPDENGGVFLTRNGSKKFLEKFEKKLRSLNQYLSFVEHPLTFRESLVFQVGSLVRAIENRDVTIYRPVVVR